VLRGQTGSRKNTLIDVTPEDLPGVAEQEGANLVALALQDNVALRVVESDVRAKECRLTGEKRGYYPTLELVSVYSLLAKFNNYDQFFKTFERNNFNAGIKCKCDIQRANKGEYRAGPGESRRGQAALSNKKTEVSAAVRVKTRRLRERDAAKEVARLEACNSRNKTLTVLQSQFARRPYQFA